MADFGFIKQGALQCIFLLLLASETTSNEPLIFQPNIQSDVITFKSAQPPVNFDAPSTIQPAAFDHDPKKASKLSGDVQCREVKSINESLKCKFVQDTPSCQIDNGQGFINYNVFVFCRFNYNLVGLAVFIMLVWWLYLFVALGVSADSFFCPALIEMSKFLRMSDNIAGVTVMAFGNGAPDVFSAIAAVGSMKDGDAGLALGALFGAGMFVTTVVAGTVSVVKPFEAMQRPLLRDVIFSIAAVFFVFYILFTQTVTFAQAIGFLVLYLVYVLVVAIGRYIYKRQKRAVTHPISIESDDPLLDDITECPHQEPARPEQAIRSLAEAAENVGVAPTFGDDLMDHPDANIQHIEDDDDTTGLLTSRPVDRTEERTALQNFIRAVSPIDKENWSSLSYVGKGFDIFKAPVVFILNVAIPVVDRDAPLHGWNKPLRLINILIGPTIALFGARASFALTYMGGVLPVWALVLALSYLLTVLVFFTSVPHEKPPYHIAFAFVGFVISVIWIGAIANEIVNLIQALGVVMNISDAILGLTMMAWGNSIADLVADVSMARQGFPRTAISACFGGPLFNILVGLGIPFLIKIAPSRKPLGIQFSMIQAVLVAGMLASLVSTLIVIPLMKFHFKRGYGFYLYSLYALFLVIAILTETGVISGTV